MELQAFIQRTMAISFLPAIWDMMGCRTETTPQTHEVLNRIRRGDSIASILLDHPQLTQAQIDLARHLQNQELELNRLYSRMQDVERWKRQVEHDLARSLQWDLHPSTTSP